MDSNISKLSDKHFIHYVEKKVRKTIREHNLFERKDKIAVAVSGGKDSTVCLYILKKLGYDVEAITIDASIGNYTKINLKNIKALCKQNNIKLNIVSFKKEFGKSLFYIRQILKEKGYEYSSCMLCGILKRYLLNKFSKKKGFKYIATGHNLDDEAEAFLMNVFRNDFSLASRQGPKSRDSTSDKFVRRVKPLFFLNNEETTRYSKIMNLPVNYEICPYSVDAHRRIYRNFLNTLEKENPGVKYSIVRFQQTMKQNLKNIENTKVNFCELCNEPASGKICKTCQIFSILKLEKNN